MILNAVEWGSGERVAVLLHGMMGSAESWHRVGPAIAEHGCRVIALDLPGHGLSPRDRGLTVERAAASVVDTIGALVGRPPALAVGHSYGGQILAAALAALKPEHAVIVDAPTSARGGWDFDEVRADYLSDAERRKSVDWLLSSRPFYSDADARVESRAAERFDPDTAAAVAASRGGSWPLPSGTVVIRPTGSPYVPDDTVPGLEASGIIVHSIEGATHSLYYSNFEEFMAALPLDDLDR